MNKEDLKYTIKEMKEKLDSLFASVLYLEKHLIATFDAEKEIIFEQDISTLNLSVRCANGLKCMGIKTIGELVVFTDSYLLKRHNFGRKSLNEIKIELSYLGLTLNMIVFGKDKQ